MNFTKTNRLAGVLGAAMALGMGLSATVAHAQPPQVTMRGEEAAHPRLHAAIHQMREALKELKEAPDDFGGNKAAAIRDTEQAIHSLRKALYYRLKMDDAALDKVQ
jgi:hypothetical protein